MEDTMQNRRAENIEWSSEPSNAPTDDHDFFAGPASSGGLVYSSTRHTEQVESTPPNGHSIWDESIDVKEKHTVGSFKQIEGDTLRERFREQIEYVVDGHLNASALIDSLVAIVAGAPIVVALLLLAVHFFGPEYSGISALVIASIVLLGSVACLSYARRRRRKRWLNERPELRH